MNLLIGSRAVSFWPVKYRNVEKSDYDIVTDQPEVFAGKKNKYEIFKTSDNRAFESIDCTIEVDVEGDLCGIPSLSDLYTIKLSHSFWNIKWDKTMWDIAWFQKHNISYNPVLFDNLYRGWVELRGRKPANLNKTNEEFFTKTVDRRYEHDDLHRATCYGERPIYEQCKEDLSRAAISQAMFFDLPRDLRIKMVKEEAYAIALERYLIPKNFNFSEKIAYRNALRLLITSLSKGWFPKFAVLNWVDIRTLDYDYVSEFKKRIK